MRQIDRYITKEFVLYFASCQLSLVTIALTFVVLGELDSLNQPQGLELFKESVLAAIPLLVELTLPIAVLLGTILTFTSLSKTSESIAMQAAGVSLLQMIRPVLWAGVVIALFFYLNQSYLAPWWGAEKKLGFAQPEDPKTIWRFYQGRLFYFTGLDKHAQTAQRVGEVVFGGDFRMIALNRYQAVTQLEGGWQVGPGLGLGIDQDRLDYQELPPARLTEDAMPIAFNPELPHPKYAPLGTLVTNLKIKMQGAVNYSEDLFALFQKLSGLLTIFCMMILALPFSLFSGRQANVRAGIVIAIVLGFVFWLVEQVFVSLFEAQALSAFVAAFATNGIFLGLGLFLIAKKLN